MKRLRHTPGFALVSTLVLMVLILLIVVGYLGITRSDRASTSTFANRARAKMMADSSLASATQLLRDNTRYGNYITAMPAPSPSPAPLYTEVYRPTDPTDSTHAAKSDDYLRLDNAAGDILVSRATASTVAGPDPRPMPAAVPTSSPFALPSPNPALIEEVLPSASSGTPTGNSYNFNQVVNAGSTKTQRLVEPSPSPSPPAALGQWVNVRNSTGELVGRYAFFVEDESMKVNVNQAGNSTGGTSQRVNDLALPAVAPSAANQVQEIDPSGILPLASRSSADTALTNLGTAGNRLQSRSSLGLVSPWDTNFPDDGQLATVRSRDDLTTARGWQRMDLNNTVANNSPAAAAQKIADWIGDAWTGPTELGAMQSFQMFADSRLRLQIGANIVDYIDGDSIPTDAGDIGGVPVIGIEKIPYLVEVDVVYASAGSVPGQATVSMSFRLNFMNLFEKDLRLSDSVRTVKITGVPVILKNGAPIFNHETQTYTLNVPGNITDAVVPWGGDNVASGVAGVKTFTTGPMQTDQVTYTPGGSITQFESGLITVEVLGAGGARLDSTKIALRDLSARWDNSTSNALTHDFLETHQSAASINATYKAVVESGGTINPLSVGDPRYRPEVVTQRWYNLTRTDTTRFTTSTDKAELDARAYSVDWYDYLGNRPLVFHRDGPMLSVGELGNVSVCEYPWRSVYLQYAGRPPNTNEMDVIPDVQDRRGSSPTAQTNPAVLPQDFVLMDLFKTSQTDVRDGGLNINTQTNIASTSTTPPSPDQGALTALFYNLPGGGGVPGGGPGATPTPLSTPAATIMSSVIANRRSANGPSTSPPGNWGGTAPIDNTSRRPYFTIGELASDMSWLINESANSTTTGNGRTRTTVNYSLLRTSPASTTWNRNYGSDMQVEEPFRKVSEAITTRGNVFRVLYVGQSIKDLNKNGKVDYQAEVNAEYLGEAFIERKSTFAAPTTVGASTVTRTSDSKYNIVAQRSISE